MKDDLLTWSGKSRAVATAFLETNAAPIAET